MQGGWGPSPAMDKGSATLAAAPECPGLLRSFGGVASVGHVTANLELVRTRGIRLFN